MITVRYMDGLITILRNGVCVVEGDKGSSEFYHNLASAKHSIRNKEKGSATSSFISNQGGHEDFIFWSEVD